MGEQGIQGLRGLPGEVGPQGERGEVCYQFIHNGCQNCNWNIYIFCDFCHFLPKILHFFAFVRNFMILLFDESGLIICQ